MLNMKTNCREKSNFFPRYIPKFQKQQAETFTPQHILLPGTLCSSTQFVPQITLLLGTLCFSEHFASWNTLLLGTHCSLEHLANLQIVLLNILCSLEQLKQNVPGSKVFQGVRYSKEQKLFQWAIPFLQTVYFACLSEPFYSYQVPQSTCWSITIQNVKRITQRQQRNRFTCRINCALFHVLDSHIQLGQPCVKGLWLCS